MTDALSVLRGPALRDRLYASRVAVRDALAANPSIALRDEIAAADAVVSEAMRAAIETYERLAAAATGQEPAQHYEGIARSAPRVGLPPPRRLPSARPVTPT